MRIPRLLRCGTKAFLTFAILLLPVVCYGQVNILSNHYDNARTGANLSETSLNVTNVDASQFGKLYSYTVDGAVYAQPLYVSGVTINGVPHNVLFVATMNDKVYAFDADSNSPPLWSRDFTNPPSVTAVPITDIVGANLNIVGNVGVESTPVIDASAGTIYLLARTKESGAYVQRLHALDITTGLERTSSPVVIQATASGLAPDSSAGIVTFNPKMENQRAGLAITNGVVLVGWASHEDLTPYHGWLMGYDQNTLQQVGVFCLTPDYYFGGIWQSGRAPAIDSAGNVYIQSGNAEWDGTRNFGDSIMKFSVNASGISLTDYFTPNDWLLLYNNDTDLGSTGVMLVPNTNLLVGGGKESVLYVVNTNNLGHQAIGNTQIVQSILVNRGEMKGGTAFWTSATVGPLLYSWAQSDVLKSYLFNGTTFGATPYTQGSQISPGSPGGALAVSANGNTSGSGVVWASLATSVDGDHGVVPGVMRAYNAENLQELWNTELNPTRDRLGSLMKFVPPVVANGKVFIPNQDGAVLVYGPLPTTPDFSIIASPLAQYIAAGSSATYTVNVGALNAFSGGVNLNASGQPAGATVTFAPATVTGAGSSTMTVTTSSSTPLAASTLTITGSSGLLTHSTPVSLVVNNGATGSGAISIDFVGQGTAMAPTESAGVVPQAFWNNATGARSSSAQALVDQAGNPSGATVSWTAAGVWTLPIVDQAGNVRMMKGYLDTSNSSVTTVTVSGLSSGTYDVYVYGDGANGGGTRTAAYQISGAGITTTTNLTDAANTNFGGTFTQANSSNGNYVKFSAISGTGFTVTATPGTASDGIQRAPLNGIQIIPTGPAVPDFTVAATPGTVTVTAGSSATYTVNVGALNGFSGGVNLSASGQPAGATVMFAPATMTGDFDAGHHREQRITDTLDIGGYCCDSAARFRLHGSGHTRNGDGDCGE